MSNRTSRGGRPTKLESEQLAEEILTIAGELFVARGVAATTMEQVISTCGIGKDTLYRRYSNKEALFTAVTQRALSRTLGWFEENERKKPKQPLEQVQHLARWLLDANLDPELLGLKREAFIAAMRDCSVITEDPFTPRLIEAIAAAHNAGELYAPDPAFVASQLIATVVLGPVNDALMGNQPLSESATRDAWFQRAWELFVNGAGNQNTFTRSVSGQ
ncbi:TetR/AcrR family transcriptional regulator [Marinobacter xestospongiae]|uniref:TetR/AcrR family transcriptional regulator n=1 Tax=Marinobacter xestospongiae TaxID=994319 RepID=A0ABU3VZV5_9GAMM|nr:TetR/AcrR family transcriptional regulator [Marinobacter xestospongiae]MDV2079696.1 TetR/AcrR family transcriptional regulator [Marinobacter xestospongiae]